MSKSKGLQLGLPLCLSGRLGAMNKLPEYKRELILSLMVEGNSMRTITRSAKVSREAVEKLLDDAGRACTRFHDQYVRNVQSHHVECDELWSFVSSKNRNVKTATAAPKGAGNQWIWIAIDRETKLVISAYTSPWLKLSDSWAPGYRAGNRGPFALAPTVIPLLGDLSGERGSIHGSGDCRESRARSLKSPPGSGRYPQISMA